MATGVEARTVERGMYHGEVDVDMLQAVKSLLADVSSVSPSSEQKVDYGLGESSYSEGTLTFEETFNELNH